MNIQFCTIIEGSQRVDMYLSALFEQYSRSYIQKMIDGGKVRVNQKVISKNIKVSSKDVLEIEVIVEPLKTVNPEQISLDILYEDDNLIVINKDAGMNVHPVPGEGGNSNTLVNAILFHCQHDVGADFSNLSIGGVIRPGIVHRLDKDTSGAIMVAKNDTMMQELQHKFQKRTGIEKYYITFVAGKVTQKEFRIESFIGRDKNDRKKMTALDPVNPKIALSHGWLLGYINDEYSVVKIKIETGRTHQIRVHLASIGFPILGDTTYGNQKVNEAVFKKYGLARQALHAYELYLDLYGKKQVFHAPLKDDMKIFLGEGFGLD